MKTNLANLISAIRILISPLIIFLILNGGLDLAAILYAFGLMIDIADGFIARKIGVTSEFGKIWDPFCSVVMFYSASFTLVWMREISFLYPLLIALVSGFASFLYLKSKNVQIKHNADLVNRFIGAGVGDVGLGLFLAYFYAMWLIPLIIIGIAINFSSNKSKFKIN